MALSVLGGFYNELKVIHDNEEGEMGDVGGVLIKAGSTFFYLFCWHAELLRSDLPVPIQPK